MRNLPPRRLAAAAAVGLLLACYLGPAALAAYNAPATIGAFTGDMTTSSGSYSTTVSKFNGGTSFGSMAAQGAGAVAITGGAINGTTQNVLTITAAGTTTLVLANSFVCVNKGTGSATAITGDASPVVGQVHILKDCKGDAATNNITFTPTSGTVDGASTYVLNQNYQAVNMIYTSAGWSLF